MAQRKKYLVNWFHFTNISTIVLLFEKCTLVFDNFSWFFKGFVPWLALAFAHVANKTRHYYFTLNPELVSWREKEWASGSDRKLSNWFASTLLKKHWFQNWLHTLEEKEWLIQMLARQCSSGQEEGEKRWVFLMMGLQQNCQHILIFPKGKRFFFFPGNRKHNLCFLWCI